MGKNNIWTLLRLLYKLCQEELGHTVTIKCWTCDCKIIMNTCWIKALKKVSFKPKNQHIASYRFFSFNWHHLPISHMPTLQDNKLSESFSRSDSSWTHTGSRNRPQFRISPWRPQQVRVRVPDGPVCPDLRGQGPNVIQLFTAVIGEFL